MDRGLPAGRALVASVALPPLRLLEPIEEPPSLNVTVPVGVPAPGATALTVAVNVTVWPNTDGLADEVTVVVEPSWLTVCSRLAEVEAVKLVSPAYETVIVCVATAGDEVE